MKPSVPLVTVLLAVMGAAIPVGSTLTAEESPAAPAAEASGTSLPQEGSPSGGERAKGHVTEITAKQLRMDTEKKIAYFDGDVQVVDPQFLLRSNRLVVYLNPNGSGMERAEAYGDVIIVQEESKRRATCQKAVYTPAEGKMELTEDPRLENERGVTRGEKITIFRQNNTILVEGGTRTVLDLSPSPPSPAAPAEKPTADTPRGESP